MIVTELIDGLPHDDSLHQILRDETLLLEPTPDPGPMKIWQAEYPPLGVMRFNMTHVSGPFSPPKGVYESDYIHIEWQRMNGRQPFYHRNQDCDEIALHVAGNRTVITELGCVDLQVGDFSMIPVGVAHDNYGQEDVHLIFYITAPVAEVKTPVRSAEYRESPFPGWKEDNGRCVEFVTEKLSALGSDTSTFRTSERLLLDHAKRVDERLNVLRSDPGDKDKSGKDGGVDWLYKAENISLGVCHMSPSSPTPSSRESGESSVSYQRHRFADEVQLQLKGTRTLVTQRGTVKNIRPGDFVSIPKGCAFSSIVHGAADGANGTNGADAGTDSVSTHVVVLMRYPAEAMQKFDRMAEHVNVEEIERLRRA